MTNWKRSYSASPSELILADDCTLAHYYRYVEHLRPLTRKVGGPVLSGSAVAQVLETLLWEQRGTVISPEEVRATAAITLHALSGNDEVEVAKYLPGVLRALTRVPDWLVAGNWHVEFDVQGVVEDDEIQVELHGRADQVLFIDDPVEDLHTIRLVDVKTTDHNPMEYVLWTPQLRMYALCLSQMYPDRLVSYQYVCVPTGKTSVGKTGPEVIFTPDMLAATYQEVLTYARTLDAPVKPRYARRCQWCTYKELCMTRIMGGNVDAAARTFFTVSVDDAQRKETVDTDPSV